MALQRDVQRCTVLRCIAMQCRAVCQLPSACALSLFTRDALRAWSAKSSTQKGYMRVLALALSGVGAVHYTSSEGHSPE